MENMRKQISTRISDFKQLLEDGNLYVDKTRFVYDLVRQKGNDYFFISRPRRYGKSLFCSTLEYVFKGEKELFKGLYIAEKTDYQFEKYPVLHLNFSLLNSSSFESFLSGFERMLYDAALENGVELKRDLPSYMLSDFLKRIAKECAILVDEFDAPVIDSLNDREKLERIRGEFASFYSVIKNTGSKVRFLFITGVTKLSNMSVFSKMNNLTDISMSAEFATAFGYTERELEDNFDFYITEYLSSEKCPYKDRNEFISNMRAYYDGYRFSIDNEESVYNPVSVGMFFNNGCRFGNYWENTGVSTLAVELAKRYDLMDLVGESQDVGMSAFTSFDISLLAESTLKISSVYALLYYTGYLTISYGDAKGLTLKFPNNEISSSFTTSLISRYMGVNVDFESMLYRVGRLLENGDTAGFLTILKKYYEAFPYDLLYKDKEKTYQLLFHAFFVASGSDIISEDHSLRGRADNTIRTKHHIYICELKVDRSAGEALSQIFERKYYAKYISEAEERGMKIHLLGISFSSEVRNIVEYKEEILNPPHLI